MLTSICGVSPERMAVLFHPDEIFSGTANQSDLPDIETFLDVTKQHGEEIIVEKHANPGIYCNAFSRDVNETLFAIHQEDAQAS